jgi:ParB family chromosome partitioning protein
MKAITYLRTSGLYPNPKQPRKHFDETAMAELAASIKSVGVLQPITVRPVESKKGHEIVCGERRWRAATAAGLDTIPCVIRTLTDEEAMDVAITENLQRKDIDPFEEATAFQYLLTEKGQTFDDIAARFGKSSIFVRGRVKLNELIEPLRKLYEGKEIPVSHCLELSKLTTDIQFKIYEDRYQQKAQGHASWRNWSLREIRHGLDNYMENLKSAPFDKTECNSCPKNTAVWGLFEDIREVSCSDKECFKKKTIEHRAGVVVKKYETNPGTILFAHYEGGDMNEKVLTRIKDEGVPYFTDKQYGFVWQPDKPKKGKNQSDEDFAAEMAKYDKRQSEIDAKIESGEYLRAMRVDDWEFGKPAIVYPLSSKKNGQPPTPESATEDLKKKDERNQELRIEKTIDEITKLYRDKKDKFPASAPLSELEIGLMYYLMSYHFTQDKIIKHNRPAAANIDRILKITEEEKVAAVRNYLHDNLPMDGHDPLCEVTIELYKQYFPEETAAIEAKHLETYRRRKASIDARIADLSEKK